MSGSKQFFKYSATINYNILKRVKKYLPGFVSAKNEDGLAELITSKTNPNVHTHTIAIDGSSHDSH